MAPLKLITLCLSLSACGSFQLASGIGLPPGRSVSDARLDVLDCKDRAHTYADSPEKQARAFMLGLTIVGAPVAYAADRADQRAAFRECMTGRGYRVAEVR